MNLLGFAALLSISVAVGGVYMFLGLKARAHLSADASHSERSIGWLFWWSFDKSVYDADGQRLCQVGNLLVVPLVALYVAWYVLLLK
jgi:hypothetical protein